MATTQTRRIIVKIDTKDNRALDDIAKRFGVLNKNVKGLSSNMSFLTNTFKTYLGALGVRELASMSDRIQVLRDRINVLEGGAEKGAMAFENLRRAAIQTNTTIESAATIYQRLSQSTSELGLSSREIIDLSKILINSFRLSGATASEATGATIQLSQGFAQGELRGQELRSVMEQNVVVAKILRKEFGQDIFKKAEKGMISAARVAKLLFENQEEINSQADKLGRTFGQTFAIALDQVAVKIEGLNRSLGLNSKFAAGMDFLVNRFDALASALTLAIIPALGILATSTLPKVIFGVNSLSAALNLLVKTNPVLLALSLILSGVAVAMVATNTGFGEVADGFTKASNKMEESSKKLQGVMSELNKTNKSFVEGSKNVEGRFVSVADRIKRANQTPFFLEQAFQAPTIGDSSIFGSGGALGIVDFPKSNKPARNLGDEQRDKRTKGDFYELNRLFRQGKISVDEYGTSLANLKANLTLDEFKLGKKNLFQYNEELNEVKKIEIEKSFQRGLISFSQFDEAIRENNLEKLKNDLDANKIALIEYNDELVKIQTKFSAGSAFQAGIYRYLNSVKTLGDSIADATTGAFESLETAIFETTKGSKTAFADMTQSILDDLTKIFIRSQIVAPLVQGLTGFFGPSATPDTAFQNPAFGGGGTVALANGGLIGGAAKFVTPTGQLGIMGEAGPEAVLPLTKTSGGNLGVAATVAPVNVNVINNSGASIETSERQGPGGERIIDVLIQNKVKEAISNGTLDRAMSASYGLKRKGT